MHCMRLETFFNTSNDINFVANTVLFMFFPFEIIFVGGGDEGCYVV